MRRTLCGSPNVGGLSVTNVTRLGCVCVFVRRVHGRTFQVEGAEARASGEAADGTSAPADTETRLSTLGDQLARRMTELPKAALQGAELSAQGLAGLGGLVQLPLKLPAGGVGPGGLLLRLLQLPLQLLHAGVCFVHLKGRTEQKGVRGGVEEEEEPDTCFTCSLYWSTWRRSSSACIVTSFSFFSQRRALLLAAARSLRGDPRATSAQLDGALVDQRSCGNPLCFLLQLLLQLQDLGLQGTDGALKPGPDRSVQFCQLGL